MGSFQEEIRRMQEFTQTTTSSDVTELEGRIAEAMVYLARSGELLAKARTALRRKRASEVCATIMAVAKAEHLSAKVQNALLEGVAAEEEEVVDTLDRLNRALTHQLDGLRTLLSFEKEAMRIAKTGY